MKYLFLFLLFLSGSAVAQKADQPYIKVLGVAQDGGYPHAGCAKACCEQAWKDAGKRRFVTSLALVDPASGKWWLFEATPDITDQLYYFRSLTGGKYRYLPDGIFITHAHIGHYAGLMQLGREVMNTKEVPVYVLPRMKTYLEQNGPWSQLVGLKNIKLVELAIAGKDMKPGYMGQTLADGILVSAFQVPHRDEFSETAGFYLSLRSRQYLFIPDIDKWEKWESSIKDMVAAVDVALLDATFFADGEIPGRSISEVPHPFVSETMQLFSSDTTVSKLRSRIHFIHFNHTNPLLWDTKQQKAVRSAGFNLAVQGEDL